jgi:cation transport regulator ChaB
MPTYLDPPKSHDHYGLEVREKLGIFQDLWKSYYNTTWINFKENSIRMDAMQSAWNALARARKEETGTGFYLTPEQYKDVHNR